MAEHTYGLSCCHCWEPIEPDAQWPDNGVHDDGLDFHDGCLDSYRIERAKEFQRSIEELAVNPAFRSQQGGRSLAGAPREPGRPAACNCESDAGEVPCPVHQGSGRWAR